MKNICTVADKNFISRVLSLDYSLAKFNNQYKLRLLCLDSDIYNYDFDDHIVKYHIDDLLKKDPLLTASLNNPPSQEALVNRTDYKQAQQLQFIWSLSAYFTDYCLNNCDAEDIIYIDSDIYFFNDWSIIYDCMNNNSIGLIEHRIPHTIDCGKYNVGILYFKKDDNGLNCLKFWKNCVLNSDNPHKHTHGYCADQKYLELFLEFFDGIQILDDCIGHLDPWNFSYHKYEDDCIIWNGKKQKLTYCHFSNFQFNNSNYIPAQRHGIMDVSKQPFLHRVYEEYYSVVKSFEPNKKNNILDKVFIKW